MILGYSNFRQTLIIEINLRKTLGKKAGRNPLEDSPEDFVRAENSFVPRFLFRKVFSTYCLVTPFK